MKAKAPQLIVVGILWGALACGGLQPPPAGECFWSATAEVWEDTNGDGVRDPGEPPLPNVQVLVMQTGQEAPKGEWRTGPDGTAVVGAISTSCDWSKYQLMVAPPAGYTFSTTSEVALSDVNQGSTLPFGIKPQATATPIAATSTPEPFNPSIEIIGEPEVVFRWETDRCADDQLVDLPVRAFRNADGAIQIHTSSAVTYRMIGADFDSLKADCTPVLVSDLDRDPSHYNWAEWIGATYTLDGKTIYAIVHEEYHADQAGSVWQADGDFGAEQGGKQWNYRGWNGATFREMRYDAANDRWQGSQPVCLIGAHWVHPDVGCDPVRAWTSPISGVVIINGRVYDENPGGGNGVKATISKGDQELWSATIENGDSQGQSYNLEVSVEPGDVIRFSVDALGDSSWDTTYFNPGINLGPPPCPSGRHDMCTLISLTHAVSTDGGQTYTQPPVPDHLVANLPYRYDPEWMRAIWQPSNIVRNPNDGYYYVLIQRDEHPADYSFNVQGMCLIRTQTLDDPASWRAWDGVGFNMRFINPYTETAANPEEHVCELVSPEIGALTFGLSYNTYLEKFIAVGVGYEGYYFSTSGDLIHWTPRQFFREASQTFAPGAQPPYYPYPTLIDHDSPSASFDVTGQFPYLYFSRLNDGPTAYNTDLLRVKVEIHK